MVYGRYIYNLMALNQLTTGGGDLVEVPWTTEIDWTFSIKHVESLRSQSSDSG